MAHLIDKAALVAEIKSRISDVKLSQKAGLIKKRDADKKILLFKSVLSLIDTLEVKEVDLDKEFDKYCDNLYFIDLENEPYEELFECAKHFFELGIRAQKGE
jgi:hypothetical protein